VLPTRNHCSLLGKEQRGLEKWGGGLQAFPRCLGVVPPEASRERNTLLGLKGYAGRGVPGVSLLENQVSLSRGGNYKRRKSEKKKPSSSCLHSRGYILSFRREREGNMCGEKKKVHS